ncbi:MAG: NAD-dependent epimerase/dehydratase family protein [Deltaproteobacteria bacterium]|nr:NAD-dependent epimerase/dehydratase family protein [Deltaproteobacteria bacterium]
MAEKTIGVLIGGSGLIGGTIVNYYKTMHAETVDIRAPSSKKLSIRQESDIRSYLLEVKPDFVINASMANLASDGQLAFEVNFLGPLNLARAAAALKIPYIHISSAATLPQGTELNEEDTIPISPELSNYAKSKLMAEKTLHLMAREHELDYSCVRLGIVYGAHDHKIQGFHRLLFSIADQSMPVLFTRKNTLHSYSNARKLPYFINHMIENREEFSSITCHFVDRNPVDLANLILTIKSYLQLSSPREIYVPYLIANMGKKGLIFLLRFLRKFGLKADLPPELMFLNSFYKSQTLSAKRLQESSFIDPMPEETIFTRLPDLIAYYLTRWSHQNLITTYNESLDFDGSVRDDFKHNPAKLLKSVHKRSVAPFPEMISVKNDTDKTPDGHSAL